MIKVGIIGATGYAGAEIVRLLYPRKDVKIVWYGSKSYVDTKFAAQFGNMFKLVNDICKGDDINALADEVDVIFTATPQGYLGSILTEEVLNKVKVVDLSADYRLKDVSVYEEWYKIEHKSPQFLEEAVYGLCELNRESIKKARLIANPGCYTTCSILSLTPLLKEGLIDPTSIIIDAKSGVSGAGRGAKVANLYCEVNESMKAYGVATHRHTPEIEEQLSIAAGEDIMVQFTPHLAPMNRGILVTAYANVAKDKLENISYESVRKAYEKYYKDEYFIRILDEGICPETRWVEGSNFFDVNFKIDKRTGRIIVMGALDNIVKGAAGQAIQNMNLICGLPETEGLEIVPMFP